MSEEVNYKVYFISDLHIAHKNILNYSKGRLGFVEEYKTEHNIEDNMEAHDKWIIQMIRKTCNRGDHLYVLGDFILSNQEHSMKILNEIKKCGLVLHLIVGNHDKSTQRMHNMFNSIDLIKVANFHKSAFPFIEEENFQIVMCHYPILSWFNKTRGSLHLYGHVHDNAPWVDDENNPNLMFNVGFDTPFANYGLIPLEKIYERYKAKLNGLKPKDYIEKVTKECDHFVR